MDSFDEQERKLLADINDAIARAIKKCRLAIRRRQMWAFFFAATWLPGICLRFYDLRYFTAIRDVLLCMAFQIFMWWMRERELKYYRRLKMEAAKIKLDLMREMKKYRGF